MILKSFLNNDQKGSFFKGLKGSLSKGLKISNKASSR